MILQAQIQLFAEYCYIHRARDSFDQPPPNRLVPHLAKIATGKSEDDQHGLA